jgi:uncharacterized Fe-S cluster protein YjdI
MGEKRKEYRVGDLTVVWQPDKCIHSEECFHGLPEVFDPGKRPWINVHGAPLERIVAQVERCPSGALSYLRESAQAKQPDLPAAVRVGGASERASACARDGEGKAAGRERVRARSGDRVLPLRCLEEQAVLRRLAQRDRLPRRLSMEHTFLLVEALWRAEGEFFDGTGNRAEVEGEAAIRHYPDKWIYEGSLRARAAVPAAPAGLPRAGLGADVLGTGAQARGSEGAEGVHVDYAWVGADRVGLPSSSTAPGTFVPSSAAALRSTSSMAWAFASRARRTGSRSSRVSAAVADGWEWLSTRPITGNPYPRAASQLPRVRRRSWMRTSFVFARARMRCQAFLGSSRWPERDVGEGKSHSDIPRLGSDSRIRAT